MSAITVFQRVLFVCLTIIAVAGCGATGHTSELIGHRAKRYAEAVNLRSSDVPNMQAIKLNKAKNEPPCRFDRFLTTSAIAGISPIFGREQGSSTEHVSSIVFAVQDDKTARDAAAAIGEGTEPGPARTCLVGHKEKERLTVQTEGASRAEVVGGPLYADLRIERSQSPAHLQGVYGLRTSGRYLLRGSPGEQFTESVYAFASGRAVIILDSGVFGRSVPTQEIARFIVALHRRASARLWMMQ